ncbi:hypothetical protein SLEP1_g29062 [Rubroshorea leprosula]|uniref:Uncharacterized protein n=1 Tax=Rubroshorea leprosula TaxID=152421 RepID=A0AAV5K262_9ROSI|nr:hypothetical protein SLEP1_g29062 [Rubroshorea leprosula]
MVLHMESLLLGQNLAAKKAVKMEAYVSPTMGDVKERKVGFKEKVFMFVSKISPKGKSWLMKWETEHEKLSFMVCSSPIFYVGYGYVLSFPKKTLHGCGFDALNSHDFKAKNV